MGITLIEDVEMGMVQEIDDSQILGEFQGHLFRDPVVATKGHCGKGNVFNWINCVLQGGNQWSQINGIREFHDEVAKERRVQEMDDEPEGSR